jgi:hypothetical protein
MRKRVVHQKTPQSQGAGGNQPVMALAKTGETGDKVDAQLLFYRLEAIRHLLGLKPGGLSPFNRFALFWHTLDIPKN